LPPDPQQAQGNNAQCPRAQHSHRGSPDSAYWQSVSALFPRAANA
jgi:hypothetical protein